MGDTKTLNDDKAIEKIKELADDSICLFCTTENNKIVSRPMATQAIDDDGTLWFFSSKSSEKNRQIMKDDIVYLMYMNAGKQHYLSLTGYADILINKEKAKELWSPIAKAWFENGPEDADLTLIKVVPEEGHYWDTKNGKLISLIKIAVAAVTGSQDDGGIDGDLRLQ